MDEKQVATRLITLSRGIHDLLSLSIAERTGELVPTSDDNVIRADLLKDYEALLEEQAYYEKQASRLENELITRVIPYEDRDAMEDVISGNPLEVVKAEEKKIPFYMRGEDGQILMPDPEKIKPLVKEKNAREIAKKQEAEENISKQAKGPILQKTNDMAYYEEELGFEEPMEVLELTELPEVLEKQLNNIKFQTYVAKAVLTNMDMHLFLEQPKKKIGAFV